MYYNKGPQLTAGTLKQYLACIPDDIKIRVGIGDASAPAHYLLTAMENSSSIRTAICKMRRK